ncbi:hypothetical protein B296_00007011 [Ensete ventricosum]|uniref:Uncharacterized protein n=1 Tax=Ensete ventricosum TaxID=4639 RepID=A0A427ABN4_ENSVE|nr:hypothetical protein B296_00007011 [Ensete ventricosum]
MSWPGKELGLVRGQLCKGIHVVVWSKRFTKNWQRITIDVSGGEWFVYSRVLVPIPCSTGLYPLFRVSLHEIPNSTMRCFISERRHL